MLRRGLRTTGDPDRAAERRVAKQSTCFLAVFGWVVAGTALIAACDNPAGPPVADILPLKHVAVEEIDTMVVLPVALPRGVQWSHEISETRWESRAPVVAVTRRDDPSALVVEVKGFGSATLTVLGSGFGAESARIDVLPSVPVVREIRQDEWPRDGRVALAGYAVDGIPVSAIRVGQDTVSLLSRDSATLVVVPPPLNGGACAGRPAGRAVLSIRGADVRLDADPEVRLQAGPLTELEPGESSRFRGNAFCLRLVGEPGARWVLAGVDRTAMEAARHAPERIRYGGARSFRYIFADNARASPEREAPVTAALPESRLPPTLPLPDVPRVHSASPTDPPSIFARSTPYRIGDRFEWFNGSRGRAGVYEVVGIYPPNIVFAVFESDRDRLWTARSEVFEEIFGARIGAARTQELFAAVFGPRAPATSEATGQLLVLFHDSPTDRSTGVAVHAEGNMALAVIYIRLYRSSVGDEAWYGDLLTHEMAHAWHFRNLRMVSAAWSIEGIADWFVQAQSRIQSGVPRDANLPLSQRIAGWPVSSRLPANGDFTYGYRESAGFLTFLVNTLADHHGQPFETAAATVIRSAAAGWHGHHFLDFVDRSRVGKAPGLTREMSRFESGWDPVSARLDWTLAVAADDRNNDPRYRTPFIRDAWKVYRPLAEFPDAGRVGQTVVGDAYRNGQFYFEIAMPAASGSSMRFATIDESVSLEWRILRLQ